jgi:Uma2 family endonuclease
MSMEIRVPTIEYPSSDGEPMAETSIHANSMMLLKDALDDFFAGRTDVFISINLLWYYQEGEPEQRVAPDLMVVTNSRRGHRNSFRSWEEGVVPNAVFEVTSLSTRRRDEEEKYWLYEELGVQEYFMFDPTGEFLSTQLRGFRLEGSVYRRLRSPEQVLESQLGFRMRPEGDMLRLIRTQTNEPILTREEARSRALLQLIQTEQRVEQAQQRAEQEQQRAEQAQQRAEQEQQRAELEQQRAEQEKQRADGLESEVARLNALLAQLRGNQGQP